jgi:2,4-dichlorophenol 6-monooxygenase
VLVWNVAPGPLPPLRLGTLICHKPFTEFVLSFLYDPAQLSLADLSVEEQVRMVRAAVGADVDVELLDLAGWQVKAQIASQYSSGRIFCMGDAVHRHPPTNGLGLNMSIADAFNLSWKLALVIEGRADESLLATYSTERQPVGAQGVQRAITSLQEGAAVDAALGLELGQSEDDGWKSLERLWESGPAGDETRTKLQEAIDLSNYQFNAHGVELGYMYSSDAIAGDDIALPAAVGDPQLHYTPTTKPGARVPHARLERSHDSLSTLDVVPDLGFALITGVGGEGWAAAADAIEKETGIEIAVVVIGTQDGIRDSYGDWAQRREVGTTGCVLVRPDRHIAWRSMRYGPDSPDELAAAVARALGRPPAFVAPRPS